MELKELLSLLATGAAGLFLGAYLARTASHGDFSDSSEDESSDDEKAASEDDEVSDPTNHPRARNPPANRPPTRAPQDGFVNVDAGDEPIKMVLAVRTDLKMGKGKMCAQCSHAAVGSCSVLRRKQPSVYKRYSREGQKKIVVRVGSEEALLRLQEEARGLKLVSYLVCDAGHTQLAPNTLTVLAVGPGPVSLVDRVTGSLKLMG